MPLAEELRADVRRLLARVRNLSDTRLKTELAAEAFALAQLAEAIERTLENPEIVRTTVARFRSLLIDATIDETQRKIVEELLADIETRWVPLARGG
jgi:MoxR-like ATPase